MTKLSLQQKNIIQIAQNTAIVCENAQKHAWSFQSGLPPDVPRASPSRVRRRPDTPDT